MMMIMMRPQIKDEHSQQPHFHHHQNHYETSNKQTNFKNQYEISVNSQQAKQSTRARLKLQRPPAPPLAPFWHLCCPVLPRFGIGVALFCPVLASVLPCVTPFLHLCCPVLPRLASILPCVAPLGICVAQFWHQHHKSPLTLSKICRWC